MKRGTVEHPKLLDLQSRLQITRFEAVGILECLWHFTANYAPSADVGRWPNLSIAQFIGWKGDADELIGALIASHWLEEHQTYRLVVHDWHDHVDETVIKRLQRSGSNIVTGKHPRLNGACVGQRPTTADNGCLPMPTPTPTPKPKPKPTSMPTPTPKPEASEQSELRGQVSDSDSTKARAVGQLTYWAAISPLFGRLNGDGVVEPTQPAADETCAADWWDRIVWPSGLAPPDGQARLKAVLKLAAQAERRTTPMAWLTTRIQEL